MTAGRNLKKKSAHPSTEDKGKKAKKGAEKVESADQSWFLTQEELARRSELHKRFKEEIDSLKGKHVHLIVFQLGQESFAMEISKVNEVVPSVPITKMPQTPKYIKGIATIRGKGIIILDLADKLGLVDASEDIKTRSAYTMVVSTERFTVGILVPEVPSNQKVSGDTIQSTIDNLSETSLDETYIKGLVKVQGEMVYFIDIDELIEGDRLRARMKTS
ncbi:chemotaxis protein CheW [Marinoscillum luteum]|uniref:Chemotaxis protein CheW n=1 Tax=Marinoscillum luteum TaxID=861051 RepID=A0ABW7N9J5_9BACT